MAWRRVFAHQRGCRGVTLGVQPANGSLVRLMDGAKRLPRAAVQHEPESDPDGLHGAEAAREGVQSRSLLHLALPPASGHPGLYMRDYDRNRGLHHEPGTCATACITKETRAGQAFGEWKGHVGESVDCESHRQESARPAARVPRPGVSERGRMDPSGEDVNRQDSLPRV